MKKQIFLTLIIFVFLSTHVFAQEDKNDNPPGKSGYPQTVVDGTKLEVTAVKIGTDNRLIIEIIFTNETPKDKTIGFAANGKRAIIYDERGYEFFPNKVKVGNKKSSSNLNHLFISDVPTKVTYSFKDINTEMELVKLFKFKIWGDSKGEINFRDMPIMK